VQRDTKEVLAELVETLRKKLDLKVEAGSTGEEDRGGKFRPNLDGLTVGVDLGDQWSHYCILASGFRGGDTLGMGAGSHPRLRTRSAGGQPAVNGRIEASQAQE
jgi:hypothetical protein